MSFAILAISFLAFLASVLHEVEVMTCVGLRKLVDFWLEGAFLLRIRCNLCLGSLMVRDSLENNYLGILGISSNSLFFLSRFAA